MNFKLSNGKVAAAAIIACTAVIGFALLHTNKDAVRVPESTLTKTAVIAPDSTDTGIFTAIATNTGVSIGLPTNGGEEFRDSIVATIGNNAYSATGIRSGDYLSSLKQVVWNYTDTANSEPETLLEDTGYFYETPAHYYVNRFSVDGRTAYALSYDFPAYGIRLDDGTRVSPCVISVIFSGTPDSEEFADLKKMLDQQAATYRVDTDSTHSSDNAVSNNSAATEKETEEDSKEENSKEENSEDEILAAISANSASANSVSANYRVNSKGMVVADSGLILDYPEGYHNYVEPRPMADYSKNYTTEELKEITRKWAAREDLGYNQAFHIIEGNYSQKDKLHLTAVLEDTYGCAPDIEWIKLTSEDGKTEYSLDASESDLEDGFYVFHVPNAKAGTMVVLKYPKEFSEKFSFVEESELDFDNGKTNMAENPNGNVFP